MADFIESMFTDLDGFAGWVASWAFVYFAWWTTVDPMCARYIVRGVGELYTEAAGWVTSR